MPGLSLKDVPSTCWQLFLGKKSFYEIALRSILRDSKVDLFCVLGNTNLAYELHKNLLLWGR